MPISRDNKERPPCIPESVLLKKREQAEKRKRKLARDFELEAGDDYIVDLAKEYTTIPEGTETTPLPAKRLINLLMFFCRGETRYYSGDLGRTQCCRLH